jgi:transcriptional antiterminator
MSFLTETLDVPLWFLIFAFASAAPLWVKWYKLFYRKFIATGILQRKIKEAGDAAEEKANILKKAAENWKANEESQSESSESKRKRQENLTNESEQPYVKIVLKTLALAGDAGMLIQSIADKLNVSSLEIKSSLTYLEKNEFVESVTAATGTKFYLSGRGKRYAIKQGYIKE